MSVSYLRVLALFFLAVFVGVIIQRVPGMILLEVGDYTIAGPLWLVILMTLVGGVLLSIIWRLFSRVFNMPGRFSLWWRRRRRSKCDKHMERLLDSIIVGDGPATAREAKRLVSLSKMPGLLHLMMAKVALDMGHEKKATEALSYAEKDGATPKGSLQFLQLQHQALTATPEELSELLDQIGALKIASRDVMAFYRKCLHRIGDTSGELAQMARMKKEQYLTQEQWYKESHDLIKQALPGFTSFDALKQFWESLDTAFRHDEELVLTYVSALLSFDCTDEAHMLFADLLPTHWHDSWLKAYVKLPTARPAVRLEQVEKWLKKRDDTADTDWVLGYLCQICEVFGQARNHYESCLSRGGCEELKDSFASLMVLQGKYKEAARLYHGQA